MKRNQQDTDHAIPAQAVAAQPNAGESSGLLGSWLQQVPLPLECGFYRTRNGRLIQLTCQFALGNWEGIFWFGERRHGYWYPSGNNASGRRAWDLVSKEPALESESAHAE